MRERSDRNVGLGTHEGTARTGLATVVQTTLESAQVWVWTRERQPAEAARTAARIVSSSPSSGSLPSMRSPLT